MHFPAPAEQREHHQQAEHPEQQSDGCVLPAQDIKTDDWSEAVSPFWQAVIQSALSAKGVAGLFKAGWTTIKVPT